jgi:hypothetical protein
VYHPDRSRVRDRAVVFLRRADHQVLAGPAAYRVGVEVAGGERQAEPVDGLRERLFVGQVVLEDPRGAAREPLGRAVDEVDRPRGEDRTGRRLVVGADGEVVEAVAVEVAENERRTEVREVVRRPRQAGEAGREDLCRLGGELRRRRAGDQEG